MAILVTIALILAITAIALNVMESEVPLSQDTGSENAAHIGIDIIPVPVEDKLGQTAPGEET